MDNNMQKSYYQYKLLFIENLAAKIATGLCS